MSLIYAPSRPKKLILFTEFVKKKNFTTYLLVDYIDLIWLQYFWGMFLCLK